MTKLSPDDLSEETGDQRASRESQTGVLGNGHIVECHPTGDPQVAEQKSRASCLMRPMPACSSCRHSKFKLVFNADPKANLQTVLCPKWKNDGERMWGSQPEKYEAVEILTCKEKPFSFCPSCPSKEDLSRLFIDKTKDGWYARFKRFSREEDSDD